MKDKILKLLMSYSHPFFEDPFFKGIEPDQFDVLADELEQLTKLASHSAKAELLDEYTRFLQKEGYIDTDATCEEPFMVDEFLSKTNK